MIDNQSPTRETRNRVGDASQPTYHAPGSTTPPPIITKQWLAWRFECVHPCGKRNYKKLYRLVLTESVLAEIGHTPESVKGFTVQEFDVVTSRKLIQILSL